MGTPCSYMQAVLYPLADAVAPALAAGRRVEFVMQGEMGVRRACVWGGGGGGRTVLACGAPRGAARCSLASGAPACAHCPPPNPPPCTCAGDSVLPPCPVAARGWRPARAAGHRQRGGRGAAERGPGSQQRQALWCAVCQCGGGGSVCALRAGGARQHRQIGAARARVRRRRLPMDLLPPCPSRPPPLAAHHPPRLPPPQQAVSWCPSWTTVSSSPSFQQPLRR